MESAMNVTVAVVNPISKATIQVVSFQDWKELNDYLAFVANVKLYAYRILGTANGNYYFKRESGYRAVKNDAKVAA